LDLLTHNRIPFAVLGNNVIGEWEPGEYDVVWFDDVQGAYELTRYVLSLGHRDFWFVGNTRLPWYPRRYEGYARAMQEAGAHPRHIQMESDVDRDIGFLATKSIVDEGQPVSAIFAGSDQTADGIYDALRDSGLRIPDDVSVVGFHDIEATFLHPHLTTVRVFVPEVGKHLTELVLRRIEAPSRAAQRFTLPTEVIRRESCSPPSVAREASREVAV
jgi:DNA-binding LacI/PurR family transcriptional regulator